jgi:hypothetical protein
VDESVVVEAVATMGAYEAEGEMFKRRDHVGAEEVGEDVDQEVGGCKEGVGRGDDGGAAGAEVIQGCIGRALVVEAEEGAA